MLAEKKLTPFLKNYRFSACGHLYIFPAVVLQQNPELAELTVQMKLLALFWIIAKKYN